MITVNPFDLLGHDDNDDPSQLILAVEKLKRDSVVSKKVSSQAAVASKPAKLPTKPLPPSQSVKEARNEGGRGGVRGAGRGHGRGRTGTEFNRESFNNDSTYREVPAPFKSAEEGEAGKSLERRSGYGGPRGSFRGGRRGGHNDDSAEGERPRRVYERHSGTGRDNGFKRDGAGRGNWGTPTDEIAPNTEEAPIPKEKVEDEEKASGDKDVMKEKPEESVEEKEPEAKEMTLEEYEKVFEEKRKALVALKTEERKVDDKDFKSMQQISSKKNNDEIFAKLGSDKDKRKEVTEKEEKLKKSVNITEFLKLTERERSYGGRGRGSRGGLGPRDGGFNGVSYNNNTPPANIADLGHFPALGG